MWLSIENAWGAIDDYHWLLKLTERDHPGTLEQFNDWVMSCAAGDIWYPPNEDTGYIAVATERVEKPIVPDKE